MKELEHLVLLGLLENTNDSKWGPQYFSQPKPRINQVSFISDFRNIIMHLKYTSDTMPKTN